MPVYAFDGEEPYFMDLLVEAFEQEVLQPHEKDFNLSVLYGKDSTWSDVINACRSYPAFAERRLVILKEAAALKDFAELERYVSNPTPSTILVIVYKHKKIDGRWTITKALKKNGEYVTFDKLKEDKIPQWIFGYCKDHQLNISQANAALLAAYLGNDLQKIVNELSKILINIPVGNEITAELIEQYIGISKDYNIFEYPKALLDRNSEKAFRIANYYIANPKANPLVVICSQVYREFSKLYAYYYSRHLPEKEQAAALKVSPFFLRDYARAANHYSLPQVIQAIILIQEFNLNILGMHVANNDHTLLKELTAKLTTL